MIKPSIGRVVWFTPFIHPSVPAPDQPYAALVTYVHGDRLVNLAAFNANGTQISATSVPLLQDDDARPDSGFFAEWMPYQIGQAKKTEAVETQAQLNPGVQFDPTAPANPSNDFGFALFALKQGKRVARAGWNGKGMWLALSCDGTREVPAANFWAPPNRAYAEANGGKATVLPSITMKTATGEILMGWLASQTDMLAEDWTVVE